MILIYLPWTPLLPKGSINLLASCTHVNVCVYVFPLSYTQPTINFFFYGIIFFVTACRTLCHLLLKKKKKNLFIGVKEVIKC